MESNHEPDTLERGLTVQKEVMQESPWSPQHTLGHVLYS